MPLICEDLQGLQIFVDCDFSILASSKFQYTITCMYFQYMSYKTCLSCEVGVAFPACLEGILEENEIWPTEPECGLEKNNRIVRMRGASQLAVILG